LYGVFLEKRMESKNRKSAIADRRDFLKGSAVTVATAGLAVTAAKTVSANEVERPSGAGYRETEHVKAFYASARF
jgi:hypothetical protein